VRMATQPPAGGAATWGDLIAQRARAIADSIARSIAYPAVTPNLLTVIGFVLTVGVAVVIANGYELVGGILVIAAGLFDMLDGAMARVSGRKTRFGAFLDSTLDRCSEAALLGGVLWLELYRDTVAGPVAALLVLWALTGSLMVSYTRARAEGIPGTPVNCEVGLSPRPQRVVIVAAGLILGYPLVAVSILVVLTTITTVQRILHVHKVLGGR
jgi:CDP-diacylglycerol--glycerol-3-phosphate 3-phosphatidyltransferase